ncbi:hypothetical protein, partial [Xanthomonas perforans]|uniref:hypothetical protein n=1 Tax=Xanthomonas perforans TaxID=442694 RepID=UPI001F326353
MQRRCNDGRCHARFSFVPHQRPADPTAVFVFRLMTYRPMCRNCESVTLCGPVLALQAMSHADHIAV